MREKNRRRILARSGLPSYAAVCVWLREDPGVQGYCVQAREAQADYLAAEMIEIADETGTCSATG